MKARELLKWAIFSVLGIVVFLVLLEVILRLLGIYSSHLEENGGEFFSAYDTFGRKHHWAWPANYEAVIDYNEFKYSFTTNSLGLRDTEHAVEKADGVFRVLMMGDSYIESFGSPNQDSTVLKLMEQQLNTSTTERKYEVMSGASAGSDLFFCYLFLKNHLVAYNPDLVVLHVNSTDIQDYCTRGGLDRIAPDSSLQFLPNPINEELYAYSHTYRFWVHDVLKRDRNTFLKPNELAECRGTFVVEARKVLEKFWTLAAQKGFQFRVIVYPLSKQAQQNKYPNELNDLAATGGVINLMDSLYIRQTQDPEALYWPVDGHFNTHGYHVFSQILFNTLTADGAFQQDTIN